MSHRESWHGQDFPAQTPRKAQEVLPKQLLRPAPIVRPGQAASGLAALLLPSRQRPGPVVIAEGFALILLCGVLDYLAGREISLGILYLVPIAYVTGWAGQGAGILAAIGSAGVWMVADVLSGPPFSHPAVPFWNALVRAGTFLVTAVLLSSLKGKLERERQAAGTDPLTGVKNARDFHEHVRAEIDRVARYRHPLTVAYLDLDNFKAVNDRLGHSVGDLLLQLVANLIHTNLRKTDVAARLGGDEFALLLPETGPESAQVVLRKMQTVLLEAMRAEGFPVTFSIGAVTFLRPPKSANELMDEADQLMYTVKRSGKNGIRHKSVSEVVPVAQRNKTILVIEDESVVRELLRRLLEAEGYMVIGAGDGQEALERLRAGDRPNLILLDLQMPVMDGWQFLQHYQNDPGLPQAPVVVVSAAAHLPEGDGFPGVAAYLQKPIQTEDLRRTAQRYC